jgi:hypothetical protein
VRPFVKSNKNDCHDAEAIAEAVERENMRFVAIKNRRPTRPASPASGAGAVGITTNQRDQSDSRFRNRHQFPQRQPACGGKCRGNQSCTQCGDRRTANKLARISWAVLSSDDNYHPMQAAVIDSN